jgi:hypothetical protein
MVLLLVLLPHLCGVLRVLAHRAQHLPAGGDACAASQQVDAPVDTAAAAAAAADDVRHSLPCRMRM